MATNNNNNRRLSPFADTEILYSIDPVQMNVLARQRRNRELKRLLGVFCAWMVRGIAAWHRRTALKRQLSEMPDHRLADIGIRRDEIAAVAAGDLRRRETALEATIQEPVLSFLNPKQAPAGDDDADPVRPLAA